MPPFVESLKQGRFVVTTEELPPKGTDITPFIRRTRHLLGHVDAINLTEASGAIMTMSPLGMVPALIAQGHMPILQITCRDRNRIAIQGEILAAAALGVTAIVGMSGDPIEAGDTREAVAVNDLDTPSLLRAMSSLARGLDLGGNGLDGPAELLPGAVVNPGASDLDHELAWMEQKVEAGAQFFQTQAVYDPGAFERFMMRIDRLRVPVLATYVMPKSPEMARRMNRSIPGVHVPEAMIQLLDATEDKPACAIELSAPILSRLAASCQGIHLIAVGWEHRFSDILVAAGLARSQT